MLTLCSVSSLFFGIAISVVFVVPVGIIAAVTNIEVTLNVLAEFIGGAAYPGNFLAVQFFKTYGVITCSQAVSFASDLKLGHYAKVPPRVMFAGRTLNPPHCAFGTDETAQKLWLQSYQHSSR